MDRPQRGSPVAASRVRFARSLVYPPIEVQPSPIEHCLVRPCLVGNLSKE